MSSKPPLLLNPATYKHTTIPITTRAFAFADVAAATVIAPSARARLGISHAHRTGTGTKTRVFMLRAELSIRVDCSLASLCTRARNGRPVVGNDDDDDGGGGLQ